VGCGTGRLLSMLSGYDKHGIDISEDYLKRASLTGAELCLSKIEDMPFCDEVFDTVVCTDVLEHVFDLNQAMTQLFRVLKPDGFLVLRVPYKEDLSCYLDASFPYSLAHLRTFDEQHLRLLVERIFPGQVIEERLGPYLVGGEYLKCPVRSRLLGGGLRLIMHSLGKVSKSLHDKIVRHLFNPVEINIVVTKHRQEEV
jgi:SAM-dependent methyltransferase